MIAGFFRDAVLEETFLESGKFTGEQHVVIPTVKTRWTRRWPWLQTFQQQLTVRRFLKREKPRVFVTDDPKMIMTGAGQAFYWQKEKGPLPERLTKSKITFTVLSGDEPAEGSIDAAFAPYAVKPAKVFTEKEEAGFYADVRYFSQAELTAVLKAFSGFKKRMKSGFKLFIRSNVPLTAVLPSIGNYRYKDDIALIDERGLPRGIMLAFADERTPHADVYGLMMQSFPVAILERKENADRYTGNFAVGSVLDEASVRDLMQRFYADERLSADMLSTAATHAAQYEQTTAAGKLAFLLGE